MKNLFTLFLHIALAATTACTKTETVEVEKIVEKEVTTDALKKVSNYFKRFEIEEKITSDLKIYLQTNELGKQYDGFFVYSGEEPFILWGYSNNTVEIVFVKKLKIKEMREYVNGYTYRAERSYKVNTIEEDLTPILRFFNNTLWGYMSREDLLNRK